MRAAREALGLSRPAFTTECGGITVRTLENNEGGVNEAGACLVAAFVRLGINANWLLTGDGPMLLADLAPKPAPPVKINIEALATAMVAMRNLAKPDEAPEATARKAVQFYQYCLDQELITPDGLGEGNLPKAG